MARKPQTTAIANYDEELARMAGNAAALTDSGGGGRFFTTRAGVLQFDDTPLPGNQMSVVIAGWCLENVYYEGKFDPNNMTPPSCFAFCKNPDEKDEMEPHESVDTDPHFDRQHATCKGCPQNEWGSADTGKGKACSNRRRLAMIPAGTYHPVRGGFDYEPIEDPEHYKTADEAFLKLAVTSGKGFDAYVRDLSEMHRRPTFAAVTRVFLTPDPKSQFKVNFELMEVIAGDDPRMPILIERHRKIMEAIDFPYVPIDNDEEEAPKRAASASKKLTRGRK